MQSFFLQRRAVFCEFRTTSDAWPPPWATTCWVIQLLFSPCDILNATARTQKQNSDSVHVGQLLFTPCDILDVTLRPQKQNSDSVWVSLAGSCQVHFDNVSWQCLLACGRFKLCFHKQLTNIWKIPLQTNVTCRGVLLQLCSRPSILLISSTIWCSFWLISDPLLSDSNQRKNRRELLDCWIPVRLRTSTVDRACEVRDQTPMRHRQWLCNEKAIAVLAGRRSEVLEGCCKLFPKRWFCWKHLCSLSS